MFKVGALSNSWAKESKLGSFYQEKISSTNTWAKEKAFEKNLPTIALFLTDDQEAGRGRGNNSWLNEGSGKCFLGTYSFEYPDTPHPINSILIGLALYNAMKSTWPFLDFSLKAPNDVYLKDKKVAGLLIENVQEGAKSRLLIGLGINLFSAPIAISSATSLINSLQDENLLTEKIWKRFLDRLLLEFTLALAERAQELSLINQKCLLAALNLNPLLKEKYTQLEKDGSLVQAGKKISWMEL